LNDVGGAVQVPLVDVGLVSRITLVVVAGKQSGSHNRGFLVFAGALIDVRPDIAIGPDQPKHRCLDV